MATTLTRRPDAETRRWIRNASDEKAAGNGCRFEEARGQFVVDWVERYCRLYEGDWAGQPMRLTDWQRDSTLRLFSWVHWSDKWARWIRRFRQASIWMAKKNKKSPTLAAWGLYLLCGDGEQGQKVFLAAKDGTQAREVAGKHAKEMLLQSPELSEECDLNLNTMQITHRATRSIMVPLSSSNKRTQQSKEGLNGSVLIDETHVVDRDLVRRISRAGISRSEPLQIEVSTAGNDPDGYGKERFDHARAVEAGQFEDQELFVAIYAAPQDLSDADLEADPLRYGKLANPAMGHTVDREEYLKDYASSKRSLLALADFKMYRLGIWQQSSNPWLRGSDWEACRREYTEDDLAGRECWAGLDLSRTQDMSALVLVFPWDEPETYRLLAYFWLPELVARELDGLIRCLAWARAGHLYLTPGNVVDYGFIRSTFRKLAAKFSIRELVYDPKYAEETTQALEQGVVDAEGQVVEQGTGVPRVAFPQTLNAFMVPCKDFERMVIAGTMHHNGHPILTWQAGHVAVRADSNQNIRPVKPQGGDLKKIDGIVAGVMGLARATIATKASVYEGRGILTI